MRTQRMNRRTVLRGAGGVAISLPFLEVMAPLRAARAAGAITKTGLNGAPKRFVVIFTSSGQGSDWFKCSGGTGGADLTLSPSLSPLERHKKDLILVHGIGNMTGWKGIGSSGIDPGHTNPMVNLLTCAGAKNGVGGGISIDQEIAKNIAGSTKFRSLELGIQPKSDNNRALAHAGPGLMLPYKSKPQDVFKSLFTGFSADPTLLARIRAKKQSILDGVKLDYEAFLPRLGADDRAKVEKHFEGIRDIEKRVASSPTVANNVCGVPAAPTDAGSNYATTGAAHMDLLVMALSCDLTRVASLLFEGAAGNVNLPGVGRGLHDASHCCDDSWNAATRWHADYFAKFFDKLKAVQEPTGGTLFDNTLVYWCTEIGTRVGAHNYDNLPVMMAGSAGGYLKTNNLVKYPTKATASFNEWTGGRNHGDLYVSFLNAMGIEATIFGQPQYCMGALKELIA